MKIKMKQITASAAALLCSATFAAATDLTLHLAGNAPVSRNVARYQCDAKGPTIGLSAGPFAVEYINGGGNNLAIVPVAGSSLIFANVSSGSGARYAAGQYIWWDAGGGVTFSSNSLSGQVQSICRRVTAH